MFDVLYKVGLYKDHVSCLMYHVVSGVVSVEEMRTLEDDAILLKVIEAYCTSAKTRHTVNSCKYHTFALLVLVATQIAQPI